jgi:tetratricopeptide (TPR) repeat protein
VQLAEDAGNDAALATALLARRSVWAGPERLPDRLADAPRIARAAEATGDLELQLEAARLHLVDVLKAEDLAAAAEAQATAEALVRRLGRPLYFWYPPLWRAMRSLAVGDLAAADGLIEQFRAEGLRANYADADKVWLALRLRLALDTGDVAPVLAALTEQGEEFGWRWSGAQALVDALLGHRDQAAAHLAEAVGDDYARVPRDLSRAYVLAHIAEAAALLGDADVARDVGRLLQPWVGQAIVLGSAALYVGSGAHHVGICLRTAGDLDGAVAMLQEAVTANERAGAHGPARHSRREFATTLDLQNRLQERIP